VVRAKQVVDVPDGSGGVERLLLDDVLELDAVRRSVSEILLENFGSRMRENRWLKYGVPAVGSIGFGAERVSGRSRVPFPPTSTTASALTSDVTENSSCITHRRATSRGKP
jgi:hypothetical protein